MASFFCRSPNISNKYCFYFYLPVTSPLLFYQTVNTMTFPGTDIVLMQVMKQNSNKIRDLRTWDPGHRLSKYWRRKPCAIACCNTYSAAAEAEFALFLMKYSEGSSGESSFSFLFRKYNERTCNVDSAPRLV